MLRFTFLKGGSDFDIGSYTSMKLLGIRLKVWYACRDKQTKLVYKILTSWLILYKTDRDVTKREMPSTNESSAWALHSINRPTAVKTTSSAFAARALSYSWRTADDHSVSCFFRLFLPLSPSPHCSNSPQRSRLAVAGSAIALSKSNAKTWQPCKKLLCLRKVSPEFKFINVFRCNMWWLSLTVKLA